MNSRRDGGIGTFGRGLYQKWMRDESLPVGVRAEKAAAFLLGLARAAVYLREADDVARDVRVIGRPLVRSQGHLTIGPRCVLRSIVAPVELSVGPEGTMIIGADAHISSGATFAALDRVELGERVEVGPHVTVYDNNFHDLYDRNALPESRPVIIEDDVWLCAKSTVLPGVRIGRGAVVSANALVVADVEAFTVVSGVPAREIRRLDPSKFVITRPFE